MSAVLKEHALDKMMSEAAPLNLEEKQFLMDALAAAALSVAERSTEKDDEAKSTRY